MAATFKIVINDTDGKSYNFEVTGHHAQNLVGKKIGDPVDGINVNLPGYKLEITGGTDKAGFAMRGDVEGPQRRRLLLTVGTGFRPTDYPGKRKKVSVRGNRVSPDITQVNMKVAKAGTKPVAEHFAGLSKQEKPEAKAETKPGKK
ncbi:MAG TPA: 30S ribosomal protein S6e [Candidatus Thermoplasmatota archaeon]|nr:30S ribosomal protein S6e [Candidatus Thermoplasmatota archaeon]